MYYPVPLHRQVCFRDLAEETGSLPEAEAAAVGTLALPVYAELTMDQKEYVAETVVSFVRSRMPVATG